LRVRRIQHPRVAVLGREGQPRADRHDATVSLGGSPLNVANFAGEMNVRALDPSPVASGVDLQEGADLGPVGAPFFEREQIERVLAHLPAAIRPAVQFAYITGWRIPSEVLKLQWRHVDFEAHVVRLDPHTTKNDESRTFPFTDALERRRRRNTTG
jgi:integrase